MAEWLALEAKALAETNTPVLIGLVQPRIQHESGEEIHVFYSFRPFVNPLCKLLQSRLLHWTDFVLTHVDIGNVGRHPKCGPIIDLVRLEQSPPDSVSAKITPMLSRRSRFFGSNACGELHHCNLGLWSALSGATRCLAATLMLVVAASLQGTGPFARPKHRQSCSITGSY